MKKGYLYILTNTRNTTLYTGATTNLPERLSQHTNKDLQSSFTAKYNLCKLVYVEVFENFLDAFERERQIKAGSRKKKIELIQSINPSWKDLSLELLL